MKKSLILLSLLGALNLPAYVYAEDAGMAVEGEEERVIHYAAEKPETDAAALAVLDAKSEVIANLLKEETLSDSALESVHEATYSLEAAVDHLRIGVKDDHEAALDTVDEAVQALHYASENHEEAQARTWFDALQTGVKELHNVY